MTTTPVVGMGVTIDNWSDRYPATVTEVRYFKSGARKGQPREVTVQRDTWKVVADGPGDGVAAYLCTPNPLGPTYEYVRNVNNGWVRKGRGGRGSKLILGRRELSLQSESVVGPFAP